jgi:catechol 2,3-dioxygenase-like lactoylglutathione lyase family enzyme
MSQEPDNERPAPRPVIDHVSLEVSDLDSSTAFYDAVFAVVGVRKIFRSASAAAYGRHAPVVWIVQRGRGPAPAYGHLAIAAAGRPAVLAAYAAGLEHGGRDDGTPGPRPDYGAHYYAAYLLDPDGYRVEFVTGSH